MEEQHNMDSFVPKEPAILKDEMHLNEFALQLCRTHGIPEHDMNGHPANIFEMNTSIATLFIQWGDENSLYLEGNRVKPQCFSCHVDDKNIPEYRDVWLGCLQACPGPQLPPLAGSMWAMCLAIASHVVIT
jgi:hypothetical protein